MTSWHRTAAAAVAVAMAVGTATGPARARDEAALSRGAAIAVQSTKAGMSTCAGCHGAKGEGQAASGSPRLAGLDVGYFAQQMRAFGTPGRHNSIMSPIAAGLDAAAMRDVAAYYASLRPDAGSRSAGGPNEAGARLADRGDWSAGVPACGACHGLDGRGVGAAFPLLIGQPASYIASQLEAWKTGSRSNDPGGLMANVARRLDAKQIAAVAAYYADLPAASTAPKSDLPDDDFGTVIREGEAIFRDPRGHAGPYVGNSLTCANCHLDAGRLANSAPMGAAYLLYPAYRAKNGHVNTFAERLQGCFRYSMNGKPPPLGDKVLVALESYAYFLAKGQPVGVTLPGRGYPKLPKPALPVDASRGATLFAARCAICHGAEGQGQKGADGRAVFPALWGADSYNWGAGMESLANASGFIKANMPLGQGGSLSDQQAWDVAAFVDSHERPQDPRFDGDVAATRAKYHDTPMSMYGRMVGGVVLGAPKPPVQAPTR